ncbi:MAG: hypothetical protein AAFS07_00355 [Pseudomonadota bacterium]
MLISALRRFGWTFFPAILSLFFTAMVWMIVEASPEMQIGHVFAEILHFMQFGIIFSFGLLVIVLMVILFILDLTVMHLLARNRLLFALVVFGLFLGSVFGTFESLTGWICTFLLVSCLLTGHQAGGPEGVTRGSWRRAWSRKLCPILALSFVALLFVRVGYGLYLATPVEDLGDPRFRVLDERDKTLDLKRALARFPDAQSCLVPGADAAVREDLLRMDWDLIGADGEAQACIFRLVSAWGGSEDASAWLTSQGFKAPSTWRRRPPDSLVLSSAWSIRENGYRFPVNGFCRQLMTPGAGAHHMGLRLLFSEGDDTLQGVRTSYDYK